MPSGKQRWPFRKNDFDGSISCAIRPSRLHDQLVFTFFKSCLVSQDSLGSSQHQEAFVQCVRFRVCRWRSDSGSLFESNYSPEIIQLTPYIEMD